jgi:hypothetical protein
VRVRLASRIAAQAKAADPREEIRRVAEDVAPKGGYGETSWNDASKTVHWVSADWTSNDELDEAERRFLAIDGVENFEAEAEASPPSGDEWERIWPEPGSDLAYERVLALATRPIDP